MRTLSFGTLLLAVSLPAVAIATSPVHFSDVPLDAWYQTYVTQASQLGIVSGYTDEQGYSTGKFGPENQVTLAEALKMAMESSNMMTDAMHTDSPYQGHWAQRYADAAADAHFHLSLTKEQLDWPATRGEMAMIMADAYRKYPSSSPSMDDYTDVSDDRFDFGAIYALTQADIMVGDKRSTHCGDTSCQRTSFRPDSPLNRAEAVKIVIVARDTWTGDTADSSSAGSVSACGPANVDCPPGNPVLKCVNGQWQCFTSASSSASEGNTIHYTADGFSPSSITIKKGTMLTILNDTDESMEVESDPHPTHTSYPPMNSTSATPPHGYYKFTFPTAGTYHFHDHLNASHKGTVTVLE